MLKKNGLKTFNSAVGATPILYPFDKQNALKIQSVIESGDFLINSMTPS
jgi:hypothetical protein